MNVWKTIKNLKEVHKNDEELLEGIKRIEKLLTWLDCLESAGVDNWSGYEYAQELMEEEDEEDE